MEAHVIACVILMISFSSICFCFERTVMIRLNEVEPVYLTDERFLSLGMDSNLIRDRWETFDFSSERLKTLAKGLSPAFLRLMGTDGDRMIFVRNVSESNLKSYPFPDTRFNFSAQDWDNINE